MNHINTIIFDFGGVLIDWNPRYMYRDEFEESSEMEHFLSRGLYRGLESSAG